MSVFSGVIPVTVNNTGAGEATFTSADVVYGIASVGNRRGAKVEWRIGETVLRRGASIVIPPEADADDLDVWLVRGAHELQVGTVSADFPVPVKLDDLDDITGAPQDDPVSFDLREFVTSGGSNLEEWFFTSEVTAGTLPEGSTLDGYVLIIARNAGHTSEVTITLTNSGGTETLTFNINIDAITPEITDWGTVGTAITGATVTSTSAGDLYWLMNDGTPIADTAALITAVAADEDGRSGTQAIVAGENAVVFDLSGATPGTGLSLWLGYDDGDALSNLIADEGPFEIVGITNTVAPAITGSGLTGGEHTLSNGTWSDTPDAFQYRWRDGGILISGATANTFTPASPIPVLTGEVRAFLNGWTGWVSSAPVEITAAAPENAAPAAFTAGMWELEDAAATGGDRLRVTVLSLPDEGYPDATGIEYAVNDGEWGAYAALPGGLALGSRLITVPVETEVQVRLRLVNAAPLSGPDGDAKTETPTTGAAVAPVLDPVQLLGDPANSVLWECTQDGTLFLAVSLESSRTAAQIEAGTGAEVADSFAISGGLGSAEIDLSEVPPGTAWYLHAVAKNAADQYSNVDTSGPHEINYVPPDTVLLTEKNRTRKTSPTASPNTFTEISTKVTDDNRIFVLAISINSVAAGTSAVTCGGVAMTLRHSENRFSVWTIALTGADADLQTIVVTHGNTANNIVMDRWVVEDTTGIHASGIAVTSSTSTHPLPAIAIPALGAVLGFANSNNGNIAFSIAGLTQATEGFGASTETGGRQLSASGSFIEAGTLDATVTSASNVTTRCVAISFAKAS